MAATLTYTYTWTWTHAGVGDNHNFAPITPRPGTHLTGYSVTLDANAQVMQDCNMRFSGGAADQQQITDAIIYAGNKTGSATNLPQNDTTAATGYFIQVSTVAPNSVPYTVVYTINVTWSDAVPPGPCQYGAQPNPSAVLGTEVSLAILLAVMAVLNFPADAIIFWGFMMGWPLVFPVCSAVPRTPPAFTDADFLPGHFLPNPLSLGKFEEYFQYGLWNWYCQCTPAPSGQPPPVNPPIPTPPPQINVNPGPPFPCSNTDICTTLKHITNLITNINLQVNTNTYQQLTPPYTLGASFPGLSGNGELAVSGILGVFVNVTTVPNRAGVTIGDPNVVWDVGHISFGSPEGWYPTFRITHNPWLILPEYMANISKVGYSIPNDVVVTITLLVAVPLKTAALPGV